jgi:hypothetical protein
MLSVGNTVDAEELRRRSAFLLGQAGMLPFWAALVAQFFVVEIGEDGVRVVEQIVLLYGLSIVSFLGGGRWVMRLVDPDTKPGSMFGGFLGAVVPPLLAWVVTFLPATLEGYAFTPMHQLLVIAFILWFQMIQDWSHRHAKPAPWYLKLRLRLTIGATTPIFLAALFTWLF